MVQVIKNAISVTLKKGIQPQKCLHILQLYVTILSCKMYLFYSHLETKNNEEKLPVIGMNYIYIGRKIYVGNA